MFLCTGILLYPHTHLNGIHICCLHAGSGRGPFTGCGRCWWERTLPTWPCTRNGTRFCRVDTRLWSPGDVSANPTTGIHSGPWGIYILVFTHVSYVLYYASFFFRLWNMRVEFGLLGQYMFPCILLTTTGTCFTCILLYYWYIFYMHPAMYVLLAYVQVHMWHTYIPLCTMVYVLDHQVHVGHFLVYFFGRIIYCVAFAIYSDTLSGPSGTNIHDICCLCTSGKRESIPLLFCK